MNATTSLPFKLWRRGKVRDVYDLGDRLLIVATDRISAYDHILPTPIPQKGVVLGRLSNFWFRRLEGVCPNHLIETNPALFPLELRRACAGMEGRAVLVQKAVRIDIECVVRGYLAGSAWKEYRSGGVVCGVKLPPGLKESSPLPRPLFTPATKEEVGVHDENISFEKMASRVGKSVAEQLKELSLKIYGEAVRYAASRGFILADTKFEFGMHGGRLILIDEVLTPDSSRYWDAETYEEGKPQDSFDKQYVRDYLDRVGWKHLPPAPALPDEVVRQTREKYVQAFERLTGEMFNG
ncbi:MAG TPA: phosphoribosylaminoimidazolesuccinocarboxamide synthase [Elusimicrobiota bacterium]|nr:phosphoribosylaminoimidazolesuccinocarboxamide synthase [Elusimicrobiota bacterium]